MNKERNYKYIVFVFILLLGFLTVWVGMVSGQITIPEDLKLKTEKENIIGVKNIDNWKRYVGNDEFGNPFFEEMGQGTIYAYKGKKMETSENEVISKRDKNSRTWKENEKYITEFLPTTQYWNDGTDWYYVDYDITTKEAFDTQTISFFDKIFGIETIYAEDFFPEAGDGAIRIAEGSWESSHNASAGESKYDTSTSASGGTVQTSQYVIFRGFLPFDTSSLPEEITIDSATVSLFVNYVGDADNDGNDWVNIVQTSQASTSELTLEDFDQCGSIDNPTEGANRYDLTNITDDAYNIWTLNETGISWINTEGYTMLGSREGHDALDIAPDVAGETGINIYWSEQSGTENDPKLTITYTEIEEEPETLVTTTSTLMTTTDIMGFYLTAIFYGTIIAVLFVILALIF